MNKLLWALTALFIFSSGVRAETIYFNDILDKAIQKSFDLKIAQFDVDISKAGIKEARSEYFPLISVGFYNSYDKNLEQTNPSINSVGDSVLLGTTRWQNALSLGLQYNLYDFGIRGKKLYIAKQDRTQKEIEYEKNLRNLKIEMVDLYTRALLADKELTSSEELIVLNKELFGMYEDLNTAGTFRKTQVMDQALKVARLINRIDTLRTEIKNVLKDVTSKTGEEYVFNELEILDIYSEPESEQEENIEQVSNVIELEIEENAVLRPEELPEYRTYQLEIEKKKAELSILQRQRLPNFKFTTSYYFYGSNPDNYFESFNNFKHRSLSFRVASSLPVFDGFKNQAQREKVEFEIKKLEAQRDKQVNTIKNYYEKVLQESNDFELKNENQQYSLKLVKEKLEMLERLQNEKLIDKLTYLTQKTELINQKFELEKLKINNDANKYKLAVLTEG